MGEENIERVVAEGEGALPGDWASLPSPRRNGASALGLAFWRRLAGGPGRLQGSRWEEALAAGFLRSRFFTGGTFWDRKVGF